MAARCDANTNTPARVALLAVDERHLVGFVSVVTSVRLVESLSWDVWGLCLPGYLCESAGVCACAWCVVLDLYLSIEMEVAVEKSRAERESLKYLPGHESGTANGYTSSCG